MPLIIIRIAIRMQLNIKCEKESDNDKEMNANKTNDGRRYDFSPIDHGCQFSILQMIPHQKTGINADKDDQKTTQITSQFEVDQGIGWGKDNYIW